MLNLRMAAEAGLWFRPRPGSVSERRIPPVGGMRGDGVVVTIPTPGMLDRTHDRTA